MELTVDKRIQSTLAALSLEEHRALEANCKEAGRIRDSIKVWGETGIIVDGHNRYRIAVKHGLPFEVEKLPLDSLDAVMLWMLDNQFGRRNLSGTQLSMARAARAKLMPDSSQEEVAVSLGITDRQLRTDESVKRAVEDMPEEIRTRIETSGLVATQKDLAKLEKMPPAEKQAVYDKLTQDRTLGLHEAIPKEEKTRHGLRKEDLEIVDQHFDPDVKRMIHVGTLKVNTKDIARVMNLSPMKRQLVFDMLSVGDVDNVGEALELAKAPAKSNPQLELTRAAEKLGEAIDKAITLLDSYAYLRNATGSASHITLVAQLKQVAMDAGKL